MAANQLQLFLTFEITKPHDLHLKKKNGTKFWNEPQIVDLRNRQEQKWLKEEKKQKMKLKKLLNDRISSQTLLR